MHELPGTRRSVIATILFSCLMLMLPPGSAQSQAFAQIVLVGDVDSVRIGQDGYCGRMERIDRSQFQRFKIAAPGRTWLRRVVGGRFSGTCSLDISIEVEPNQIYAVRYTDLPGGACSVETFKIQPNSDPVRYPLTREADRSCLVP